jgi:hypothetical protein
MSAPPPLSTYYYHIYDHKLFGNERLGKRLPPFARVNFRIPISKTSKAKEHKWIQCLKSDMAKLREIGGRKGIVDPAVVRAEPGSVRGRDLLVLKVGKGEEYPVLITGGHHGNEWTSVEIPFLIAQFLIVNYTENPAEGSPDEGTLLGRKRIKHLLENRQIWFVPMVNPDGHYMSMTATREQRKNAHEVDINRNYPTETWGQVTDPEQLKPDSGAYPGPGPASEPEVQSMAALISRHRFKASISYHNYSKEVLYFHDGQSDKYLIHVAKHMQALLNRHLASGDGGPYGVCGMNKKHPSFGHIADYCYEHARGQPTLGLELPPRLHSPKQQTFAWIEETTIEQTFHENLPAALALINSAGFLHRAGPTKIQADSATRMLQLVRSYWEVFKDWKLFGTEPDQAAREQG